MTRRPVLPGASELFRRTDTPPAPPEVTELPNISTTTSSPALRGAPRGDARPAADAAGLTLVPGGAVPGAEGDQLAAFRAQPVVSPRHPSRGRPAHRPDRTKHDEKITVYISADDLVALESARLSLRAQ